MPLRALLRYLLNNEQLIQKLADSYAIRRAAKLTAYWAHKGKQIGQEGMDKLQKSEPVKKVQEEVTDTSERFNTFKDTFMKEFKDWMKEIRDGEKKDKKR